ncbi:hypothetical protein V6N11_021761 [Hibiscus sabdariffa]|uniref:Uncharacterized protein n=1 Tax=Hibiscus sabdariffa TaxID=183260 RepID=A0ABR2TH70_9ROSI
MESLTLEQWRDYFRTANSDIFDIIEHAIMVAALDCPKEFRLRREHIAEKLFTCNFTRCSGCDGARETNGETGGSKESNTNSSGDDPLLHQIGSNYSYGEAEALTDEIEQESMIVGEVLRIKDILLNTQDEPDSLLFEALRRLQLMALTLDSRYSQDMYSCTFSPTFVDCRGWKELVGEWVTVTEALAEGTPESMNPFVVDEVVEEEGLPSPPLDEGAFFAAQPTSMELSQFFDGMDDDGNPRSSAKFKRNRDSGRKPSRDNENFLKGKKQTSSETNLVIKNDKSQQMKRLEPVAKPNNRPSSINTGSWRSNTKSKLIQKSDKMAVPKNLLSSQQDKFKNSDELSVQEKLEATKRKLQERYQQAENGLSLLFSVPYKSYIICQEESDDIGNGVA